MPISREINRVLIGLLAAFGLVAIAAAYWATFGPVSLLEREDNPRRVEAEAAILRGDIVDRGGVLLAESISNQDRTVTRQYVYPETASVLGYYSLRYGVGGAEAAYDALLRGDTLIKDVSTDFFDRMLHRPQIGSSIQLTLDLAVQQQVMVALSNRTQAGAAVILSVPSGEVLALVSLPSYDPNTLDATWETLVRAAGNPFFNRALQGSYQPGGTLQTPLMAAALLDNQPLENPLPNATDPVQIDGLVVNCAVRLPFDDLTLRDAYAFACPEPFVRLAQNLGASSVQNALDTFHFDEPPTLPGFVPQAEITQPALTVNSTNLVESALGQAGLTVSPLEMAMMAAAVINDGNAPQPYVLLASRAPESEDWLPAQESRPTIPYATANNARRLQDLMRDAVANGAASNAGRPNIDIGGHATVAYSGEGAQAWFIGFATIGGRQAVAVAVVIEDSADPGLAADIGGTALAAAHAASTTLP
jgi:peptidoglycan glycosyltransferase